MAISIPTIRVALVGVTLIFLLTGCPGSISCPDVVHQFAITAQFTPQRDSVRVGDTLYLSSSFPAMLTDVQTGEQVNYANAKDMGSDIFIDELPTDRQSRMNPLGNIKFAVNDFNVFAVKGRIYTDATLAPTRVSQLAYKQSGTSYELLIGFIPQKRGVYCLTIGNGLSNGRPNQDCDKAGFTIRLSNANQHLSYLANYLGDSTVAPFSARGGYCFKVY